MDESVADAEPSRSRIPADNRKVAFELPFPLLLQDLAGNVEMYVACNPPASIALVRRTDERAVIQSPGVLLGGDPYGRTSFTAVQVRFSGPVSSELHGWTEDDLPSDEQRSGGRECMGWRWAPDERRGPQPGAGRAARSVSSGTHGDTPGRGIWEIVLV